MKNVFVMVVCLVCVVALGASAADWPTIDLPEKDPIGDITLYPEAYLDWMDNERRTAGNTSIMAMYPEVVKRGRHYDDMLTKEGPAALAKAMVEAYPTENAWLELAGGAVAMAARTGYMGYHHSSPITKDKQLGIPKDVQQKIGRRQKTIPDQLVQQVNPVIDEILKINSPYAKDVAAEMLLQLFSETLGSGHCESHNGRREIEPMPKELTARAAAMLGADDPFTDAVAEWAVSVNVCNEIETSEGKMWLNEDKPAWWSSWYDRDSAKDLQLDYIRQAIQLQMHRRGQDLVTLSNDQMRRALIKADWIKSLIPVAERAKIDALVQTMQSEHKKFSDTVAQNPNDLTACRKAFLAWRPTVRAVVMSGPDMDFDSVLFATHVPGGTHGQPSSQNSWGGREGDIYVQSGLEPGSPKKALLGDKMPPRLVGDMDIWFDGDKAIFCAATGNDQKAPWKLYEIDLEGKALTKLPSTGGNTDDHNCAYLPDGGVVFASTAADTAVMCTGSANSHQSDIFIMEGDRKKIRRLSFSKDDDDYPYVLNNGMVVWMRWDYQERGVDEIFSLWTIRPDGSGADAFYRCHIPEDVIIQTLRDPASIPGSNKIIAVGGSHRTGVEGHLIMGDPAMGINNPLGIRTVTPYTSPMTKGTGRLLRPVEEGGVPYPGGMTCTPQALTEKTFLASISHDMPESNFWLYYVDVWGNKELIHRDKALATVCAFAVKERQKPPQLPIMTDPSKNYATCYVEDVYADLPGVEKGEVKYLRILKNVGWPINYQFHPIQNPGEVWGSPGTGGPIQVIGTVPVEEDGSAYFEAPAAMDLYFQALDVNHVAVQRMRTHVELGRGENRSCIGCHETRDTVAVNRPQMAVALNKTAVRPTPPPWGDTTFMNYETMIQPIFEAKCVKCHGVKEPKAGLDLSATKDDQGFMQSFRSIWGIQPGEKGPKRAKQMTARWGKYHSDHPWYKIMADYVNIRVSLKEDDAIPNPVKKYGAVAHPLVKKVTGGGDHGKLLTDEEKQYLMTWFDIQSPYNDTFYHWLPENKQKRLKPYDPFGDSRDYVKVK
ncbi:MAG: hypothetical protein ACLFQ6_07320 [Candidatus Sumerlaeia bacterium]